MEYKGARYRLYGSRKETPCTKPNHGDYHSFVNVNLTHFQQKSICKTCGLSVYVIGGAWYVRDRNPAIFIYAGTNMVRLPVKGLAEVREYLEGGNHMIPKSAHIIYDSSGMNKDYPSLQKDSFSIVVMYIFDKKEKVWLYPSYSSREDRESYIKEFVTKWHGLA